jgi:hypothetical protein
MGLYGGWGDGDWVLSFVSERNFLVYGYGRGVLTVGSGYECPTASPTLCFSVVPPPGTVSLVTYDSDHCASSTFQFSFDSDQASELYTRSTTVANRFGVVAHAPRVVLIQTEDSSSSTTTSGSAPGTSSGGPENTNTADGGGSSGGLSSGAKIAIGLGVAMPMLAVIAAGLFLFFFLRRRKAAKAAAAAAAENEKPAEGGETGEGGAEDTDFKAELHGTSGALAAGGAGMPFAKPELDSAAVQELQGDKDDGRLKPELDGQVVRELHGDVATPSELGTEHTVVAELPDSQAAAAGGVQSRAVNGEARERDQTTTGLWDWSQPLETSPSVSPGVNTVAGLGLSSAVSPEEDARAGRR